MMFLRVLLNIISELTNLLNKVHFSPRLLELLFYILQALKQELHFVVTTQLCGGGLTIKNEQRQ